MASRRLWEPLGRPKQCRPAARNNRGVNRIREVYFELNDISDKYPEQRAKVDRRYTRQVERRGVGVHLVDPADDHLQSALEGGQAAIEYEFASGGGRVVCGLIAYSRSAIILWVKQLLLRVPEDVHRRLAARAAREGKSINSVATGILDAAADADRGNRRQRLVAKAGAAGTLSSASTAKVSPSRRRRILESTRGLGPIADRLISVERDRL